MVLSARDVTKRYRTVDGSVDALAGVSLADRHYERAGQEIRLVCMMHLGDPEAYRAIVRTFSRDSTIVSEFAGKRIVREPVPLVRDEPLKLELQHFVDCVREKQTPRVSGESAKAALDLAFEITRQAQQSL